MLAHGSQRMLLGFPDPCELAMQAKEAVEGFVRVGYLALALAAWRPIGMSCPTARS